MARSHCQPDVFDQALAARKDELENVKIRFWLAMYVDLSPSLVPAFRPNPLRNSKARSGSIETRAKLRCTPCLS